MVVLFVDVFVFGFFVVGCGVDFYLDVFGVWVGFVDLLVGVLVFFVVWLFVVGVDFGDIVLFYLC